MKLTKLQQYKKSYYKNNKDKYEKYYENNRDKVKQNQKNYYKNNKDKVKQYRENNRDKNREQHLYRTYGITIEEYNQLFNQQKGCCAICRKHQSELKVILGVDHNHETGKIRALLCRNCNLMLGMAEDNTENLAKGIEYLNNYK